MSNRVKLAELGGMQIGDVARLPVEQLAMLQEDIEGVKEDLKRASSVFTEALKIRYGDKAAAARKSERKDSGTVRLDDDEYEVAADLPKKVKWDGDKLSTIFDGMALADASHYCKATIEVAEAKYKSAPPAIKALLDPARTVATGAPTFKLILKDAA